MNATAVKLAKAGDSLTMTVERCGKVGMGKYPETEFIGYSNDGELVCVVMPKTSADRQLVRLDRTEASIVGNVITISRDPNTADANKPFWGVNFADAAPVSLAPRIDKPKTNGAPTVKAPHDIPPQDASRFPFDADEAPQGQQDSRASGAALYGGITKWVLEKIVPLYADRGIDVTMEGTAAIVATIFIQANKR